MARLKKKTKKLFTAIIIIVLIAAGVIIPQIAGKTVDSSLCILSGDSKELLAAHRGLSSLYPQNTMPAFEAAVKASFYAFECDIHTTKDGKWVVIHDDTVDDMTDSTGEVDSYTLDELLSFRIDNGNGIENYPDLHIPQLEEVLSICDTSDIVPIIEIKKCDVQYLPDFYELLKAHSLTETVVIISFDFNYLLELQKTAPELKYMYLTSNLDDETVENCIKNGNIGIDFNLKTLWKCTKALKKAQNAGLDTAAWTVDNTIYADIMRLFGVELITTNRIIP